MENYDGCRPMNGRSVAIALLMLIISTTPVISATPTAGRQGAGEIAIEASPASQTVDRGEVAEYVITVTNLGDQPASVTLSSRVDQPPNTCSANVDQIPQPIDAAESAETTLFVNITTSAEVGADCLATVTASSVGAQPVEAETTTTVGDGEPNNSNVFGVTITAKREEINNDGSEQEVFEFTVENTGQVNQNVSLEVAEENSETEGGEICDQSGLETTLSETVIAVERGEEETVTMTVDIPMGSDSGRHCYRVTATVVGDPSQEAKDSADVSLVIPPIHECTASVSPSSVELSPGEQQGARLTLANTGNEPWTVGFKADPSTHATLQDDPTKQLDLDGQVHFDLDIVLPEDSTGQADSTVTVRLMGTENSKNVCEVMATIKIGRSYGGDLGLSDTLIDDAQPNSTETVTISVTNTGNGPDTYYLTIEPKPGSDTEGWATPILSETSVTVEPNQNTQLTAEFTVPGDSIAGIDVGWDIRISSEGVERDRKDIVFQVAKVRAVELKIAYEGADQQVGRRDTEVRFPLLLRNTGNDVDTITLSDEYVDKTTEEDWPIRYVDENDEDIQNNAVTMDPFSEAPIYAIVSLEGGGRGDAATYRITATSIERTVKSIITIRLEVDNNEYSMALIYPQENVTDRQSATFAPGQQMTWPIMLTNTGDADDIARVTVSGGVEGLNAVVRFANGTAIESGGASIELEEGEVLDLSLTITASEQALSGTSSVVTIRTWSQKNTGLVAQVTLTAKVEVIKDVTFEFEDGQDLNVGDRGRIDVRFSITNRGNMEEQMVLFASEPIRGWSTVVYDEEGDLISMDEIFTIPAGSTINFTARVSPPQNLVVSEDLEVTMTLQFEGMDKVGAQHLAFAVSAEPPEESLPFPATLPALILGLIMVASLRRRMLLKNGDS